MHGEFIATLVLAIPIICFPVILWYSDIDRGCVALYRARKRGAGGWQEKATAGARQGEDTGRWS